MPLEDSQGAKDAELEEKRNKDSTGNFSKIETVEIYQQLYLIVWKQNCSLLGLSS